MNEKPRPGEVFRRDGTEYLIVEITTHEHDRGSRWTVTYRTRQGASGAWGNGSTVSSDVWAAFVKGMVRA